MNTQTLIKINDETHLLFTTTFDACMGAAQHDKSNLIELITYFEQEGEDGWIAKMVESDSWTDKIHSKFWSKWNKLNESLADTVIHTYNEFYPLN